MQNATLKLTAIGGLVITILSQLDPKVTQKILALIPAQYQGIALSIIALVSAGAALKHPAPGQKP